MRSSTSSITRATLQPSPSGGIKFFFEQTLNRNWSLFSIVRPAPEHKFPVILSLEEVREILNRVRLLRYRVCLSTIYACGLRLQEGIRLAVPDIDSARMMIHVRHGKGNKDRYVPLPQRTLELLRDYWSTHRNPSLIFPAEGRGHIDLAKATEPMSKSSVQDAFRADLKQSGINKRASVHTLRHYVFSDIGGIPPPLRCCAMVFPSIRSAWFFAIVVSIRPPITPKSITPCSNKSLSPGRR
jgi:site-specific recombinase XerD